MVSYMRRDKEQRKEDLATNRLRGLFVSSLTELNSPGRKFRMIPISTTPNGQYDHVSL
jgi:hypothetical protein